MSDSNPQSAKRLEGEPESEWQARIRRIRRETVIDVLESFGFTVDDINEVQADLQFLRKFRKTSESVSAKTVVGFIGLFFAIVGLFAAWLFQFLPGPRA